MVTDMEIDTDMDKDIEHQRGHGRDIGRDTAGTPQTGRGGARLGHHHHRHHHHPIASPPPRPQVPYHLNGGRTGKLRRAEPRLGPLIDPSACPADTPEANADFVQQLAVFVHPALLLPGQALYLTWGHSFRCKFTEHCFGYV